MLASVALTSIIIVWICYSKMKQKLQKFTWSVSPSPEEHTLQNVIVKESENSKTTNSMAAKGEELSCGSTGSKDSVLNKEIGGSSGQDNSASAQGADDSNTTNLEEESSLRKRLPSSTISDN